MRFSPLYWLLSLLSCTCLLTTCGSDINGYQGNFGQHPRLLLAQPPHAPASQTTLAQFAAAHTLADSIVKLVLADTSACKALTTTYSFSYAHEYKLKHLTDTLRGPPAEYRFGYGLLHNQDTIQPAFIYIGADMRINYCDIYELIAYKKFLNHELGIGPSEAMLMASPHGLKKEEVSMSFHAGNYYWDTLATLQQVKVLHERLAATPWNWYWSISEGCNGCTYLQVDAASGKVYEKRIIEYIH